MPGYPPALVSPDRGAHTREALARVMAPSGLAQQAPALCRQGALQPTSPAMSAGPSPPPGFTTSPLPFTCIIPASPMPIAPLPQSEHAPSGIWRQFLDALREAGFEGEIDASYGTQTLFATDNSLYQYPPKAVLFPRHAQDVQRVARLLGQDEYREVTLAPRGGGTGTNGQYSPTGW